MLSSIIFTVVDGGLGILPPDNGNLQVSVGCCSKGTPGTLYVLGSIQSITTYLGYGPLAEAVALKMASGAAIQYAYVLPQTNVGALSAVTHTGPGYGTVAVASGPAEQITMLCTLGGAFATAKFTFAIGSGTASQPVTSAASPWVYTVPGTSTVLTVTAAGGTQTFTAGDSYTISPTGTVTAGGSNVTTNTVTQASQPFDQYDGNVQIGTSGTFGTGLFRVALDYRIAADGTDISNYGAPTLIPTAGKYAIPNSGIYLTFAQPIVLIKITTGGALGTMAFDVSIGGGAYTGSPVTSNASAATTYAVAGTNLLIAFTAATYTLNDIWTISAVGVITHSTGAGAGQPSATGSSFVANDYNRFLAAPPWASNTDLTTAFTALVADQQHTWSMAQVVGLYGSSQNATAAATTFSSADSSATAGFAAYRFFRVMIECPTLGSIVISGGLPIADVADTDTVVSAAFASAQSAFGRVQVGAGDFDCVSPITGRYQRRNAIWQEAARLNTTPFKQDPGWTGAGSLGYCRTIFRDEAQVPALDAARLVTLRTYQGNPGFYITAGPTLALTTSDFAQIPNCRVVDRCCQVTNTALFPYLRGSVPVDSSTGFIQEGYAQRIEGVVNGQEVAALKASGQVSDVVATVSRTANILSTGRTPWNVAITPVGYSRSIDVTVGLVNPAIAAAA